MKFFLHINQQVKGKNSKAIFLTGSGQVFCYACLTFRLSPRLIIATKTLQLINCIPCVIKYLIIEKAYSLYFSIFGCKNYYVGVGFKWAESIVGVESQTWTL